MISPLSTVLLCVAALFAAAHLFAAWLPSKAGGLPRMAIKTLPLLLVALVAWMENLPPLLVAGFLLSAIGDACLTREGDRGFMAGLGSFLVAHLLYAAQFHLWAGDFGTAWPVISGIIVFALLFGALLVSRAGPLALPVAAYIVAIALMGIAAAGVGGAVLAGALLFIASDAVLGSEKFLIAQGSRLYRLTAPAVWILYLAGQGLILAGSLVLSAGSAIQG